MYIIMIIACVWCVHACMCACTCVWACWEERGDRLRGMFYCYTVTAWPKAACFIAPVFTFLLGFFLSERVGLF